MIQYYIALLPLFLFLAFAGMLVLRVWTDRRQWAPASRDQLLRPAGENLRQHIEQFDSRISEYCLNILMVVLVQVFLFFIYNLVSGPLVLVYVLGGVTLGTVSITVWYLVRLAFTIGKRCCYARGLNGERLTGEYLNLLMLDGYRVFHDLPFDGFNVDHAVVGPAGVFAVETKAYRKKKGIADNNKVVFDGEKLHWPDGKVNDRGIKNAFDRAASLQKWLSSAVGESIQVNPVLVFPGWLVESEKSGRVRVLNPKMVRGYLKGLEKYDAVLSDTLINRITHQLAEKFAD